MELLNDPYTSYLLWPHLHFSGTFRADPSTVNNLPSYVDTTKFVPSDQFPNSNPFNWNPTGTGEWRVNGSVTRLCYADGTCRGHEDPAFGAAILGKLIVYCLHVRQFKQCEGVKRNIKLANDIICLF